MHTLFRVYARDIASFGVEDGLQLLQTVAHGSRYESVANLPELVANCSKQLINHARTWQRGRQRERQGIGKDKGQTMY